MATEMEIRYSGGVKFVASTRGHELVCDQPKESGGEDEGMTPPELLLASLGTCSAFYAVEYLKVRRLETADLRVRVTAEKAKAPARLDQFQIEVFSEAAAEERHREGLNRAVQKCLIHATLSAHPAIEIRVSTVSTGVAL